MTVSHLFPNKMAVTMVPFWFSLILSIIGTNAAGEFSILYSPDSLSFNGQSKVLESTLKEVFSASCGLSVEENSEWNGLSIIDPFNTPEAVVEVYIDGVSSLGSAAGLKSKTFPLTVDEYEPDTYDELKHRIKQRFTNGGNKLVNFNLNNPEDLATYSDVFGEIAVPKVTKQSLQHLKYTVEEDVQFLYELAVLKAITQKIESGVVSADNIIDIYNFRFRSLHALSDFHGPNSLQTKEAKKLLGEALEDLTKAFVKAYDGSALVTAVTTDVAHTRRAVRSLPDRVELKNSTEDDGYSADYAAIFNIILWFGVVFAFTLVAIVYALMDMDPGRDSIIYRMTSTRMKKDN
ncbi:ATPase H(+)-transporting accessory protein 2-like [Manduca sexta]|uniref:ATPase H(+)-transporting accessory protein 2-like n=1 Tax=Manduca sexta TaxID=7130 RepID=UPI00188F4121|nr:ATPase H(+)-transporting accessory protein 2-like [Manduca sexta]